MGEPPRLWQITLPRDRAIIYFVTLCVVDRQKVLANQKVFAAVRMVMPELQKWRVMAVVVMPDHMHCIISPGEDRSLSVGDFASGFKRLLRQALGKQEWEWQRGCFDRLLRSDENLHNKWTYVWQNPVRAGLVKNAEDWPFFIDLIDKEGSYQFPLQEKSDGKLSASPTEAEARGKLAASPIEERD